MWKYSYTCREHQAGQAAFSPERPGSESGPRQPPSYPPSIHGSQRRMFVVCLGSCVCSPTRGHHLSLIGTQVAAARWRWRWRWWLNLRYNAASIKTEGRHFLPVSLMNIKDGGGSATTHKEKLQPYYFICITCNGKHIGAAYLWPYQEQLGCKYSLIY